MNAALNENIERFETASAYGLDLIRVLEQYKKNKQKFRIVLNRPAEDVKEITSSGNGNRLKKFFSRPPKAKKDEKEKDRTIVI